MNRATVVCALLLLTASPAAAQDSHYWTQSYGPRSTALGGVVIGSVNDISGVYYNPGALALTDDLAFALSANVFAYTTVSLEDGGGQGVDLGTAKSGFRPSLVAGTIKRDLFGSGVLAFSALTRSQGEQELQGLLLLSGADIPPEADLDEFAGLVRFEGKFNDTWAGLTWSQPLSDGLALGVSWYGALRTQRRRSESLSQGVSTDGSGVAVIDARDGKYSTIRTLFKLGTYAKAGPFTGGLTLTTPSIHIAGSGQLGIDMGTFAADTAALAVNLQTDVPAEFKSPLSVGFGLAWRLGNTRLHGSAEWFDAIEPYFVMQGEDFVSQEPGEVITVDAVQELDEVFNWGVGVEHAFTPKVSAYASYRLDASGLTESVERANLSALPYDIRAVTVAADFMVSSALFTLGFGYGWGSQVDQALTDLLRDEDEEYEATFAYRSFRFLFGFEIGLG